MQAEEGGIDEIRQDQKPFVTWKRTANLLTICIPDAILKRFMRNDKVRRAWREKVALCMIIGLIMIFVTWFVVLLKFQICTDLPSSPFLSSDGSIPYRNQVMVRGLAYDFDQVKMKLATKNVNLTIDFFNRDLSRMFVDGDDPCRDFQKSPGSTCKIKNKILGSPDLDSCVDISLLDGIPTQTLTFEWDQLTQDRGNLLVFDSYVLNLTEFFNSDFNSDFSAPVGLLPFFPVGSDITHASSRDFEKLKFSYCLQQKYAIGRIGSTSLGCVVYSALTISAFIAVLGVMVVRFVMAFAFHWIMASKLVSIKNPKSIQKNDVGYMKMPIQDAAYFSQKDDPLDKGPIFQRVFDRSYSLPTDLYTICMVTCYSEDENSIRSTLDAIAGTSYPDEKKLLFVVCDGLIKGAGNSQTTPAIVISMVSRDPQFTSTPQPMSYLAIADGVKQHNMAQVYAGQYYYRQKPVPIIVVVKCGTPQERISNSKQKSKPGNRGKRDSQLILMHFLSRVTFDDRMTALDYDLFMKIKAVTNGVTADKYELLLMVDADTIVEHDSVRYMVQSMVNDEQIMGLCGETRVANKMQNWVTMIQVYEYFTNHNLGKSFESVFGGVTCLPGCFSMYRIKSKSKKTNEIVPLLVNPDVVECYSENVVDTLHKKNLLLLGEDRFLSTLMLATFSKRKMIFVPQAICHTTVPHTYKMLQSQRRRWINSTIHNLLELVLLPNLCGTFCLSISFVIGLDLFGTVSLPAAVILTFYLILSSIFTGAANLAPLILLLTTLFLPAVLVLLTTKKSVYVLWMFVYLLAIPIWNFALPLYAFWHFDDFSWGDTRRVEGEVSQSDHSNRQGTYEIGSVSMKRWQDWEMERRANSTLPLPPIPEESYITSDPSFRMDTSELSPAENARETEVNTKWKIVAVSNAKNEPLEVVPVSHQGSLAQITSTLSEDDGEDLAAKPTTVERPQTAFYIPENNTVAENNGSLAAASRKAATAYPALPPPLPKRPSTHKNAFILPGATAVQPQAPPILPTSTTTSNEIPSGTVSGTALRKPPSLAKLEARKATADDSTPRTMQNSSVTTNLPLKAGNTINQYWKSLYNDQMEEFSQQILPSDGSNSNFEKHSSVASKIGEPVLSSATTAQAQPPKLASPVPVLNQLYREPPVENRNSNLQIADILAPLDKSISFDTSFGDILERDFKNDIQQDDSLDSVESFATAKQFQSNTSLSSENFVPSKSQFSEPSISNSAVQGPRPQPWDDVDFGEFNIEKEAKTSTTTKAFKNMMKRDSISKIFKAAFLSSAESRKIDQSRTQDLSRNSSSRLMGSREFVEASSIQDRTNKSHSSSRVRGPRPPKF